MIRTMVIGLFALLILMFLIILYCCLVVASREDDWMEQQHIRWELEQQKKNEETAESPENPADANQESEVSSA